MTGPGRAALAAASVLALAATLATPTRAQTVPEGQSCGGLLCDMGVVGHKTEPAPAAAPPPASAALFDARPVAEAAPRAAQPRVRRHAVAAPTRRPPAAPREAAVMTPPPRAIAAPAPTSVPAPERAPTKAPTRSPAAPTRAAAAGRPLIPPPTAPATAMQMPAPRRPVFYFQSVDPTLQ